MPDQTEKIRFLCSACSKPITAPAIAAGKRGKCPSCEASVLVPAAKAPSPAPAKLVREEMVSGWPANPVVGEHPCRNAAASEIECSAFSPDGNLVVYARKDKGLHLWNVHARQQRWGATDSGVSTFHSLAISHDGRHVVSGHGVVTERPNGLGSFTRLSTSEDCCVRLWDAQSGALLRTLQGHRGWVVGVAISPDGRHVVSGSWDETVCVWDVESGKLEDARNIRSTINCVAFSPDGENILYGHRSSGHGGVAYHLATKKTTPYGDTRADGVAFSPDNRNVLAFYNTWLTLWDLQGPKKLRSFGHESTVTCATFSPDGSHILSGTQNGFLKLWNTQTGEGQVVGEGQSGRSLDEFDRYAIACVEFSPDGRYAVAFGNKNCLRLLKIP